MRPNLPGPLPPRRFSLTVSMALDRAIVALEAAPTLARRDAARKRKATIEYLFRVPGYGPCRGCGGGQ